MSAIRVFGIGSPFGDDQIGWEVVKALKQRRHYAAEKVQLECCDRPGVRLLELMAGAKTVFLIDAVKSGATAGTLFRFQNEEIDENGCLLSSHAIGVAQALQLGRALGGLPDDIILYGIEISNLASQKVLSTSVNAAAELVENEILSELKYVV